MKKFFLLLVLSLGSIGLAFAQANPALLQSHLDRYFLATQAKDWKTVLDMVHPKVFSLAPREIMEQMYSQMENESGMRFDFGEITILHFKTELVHSDTVYIPVDYAMTLEIHLNPSLFSSDKQIQQLFEAFQIAYSGQQISFDEAQNRFTINLKNTLIASTKKDSNHWYFGEYKANDPLTRLIFPDAVLDRLREGWN